ncbi:MAG: ABC transporter ATP-binding protein [Bacteroidaceae bacterium]|nr:ABC transporter ATP-binding protein [Bacteroidaceae bacterium]
MTPIVSVRELRKSYTRGRVEALRGVSFDVSEGEMFGLIGPDGAGKTTIFRILATLLLPDSGSATVDGLDIRRDYTALRHRIGYMPGRFSLYPDLTVGENLHFFASTFGTTVEENYDLVRDIYSQIEPFADRRAGKLSGGMKQKLALSCALIHAPRVLFLDEPTTGVDPVSRREFWQMLGALRRQYGISVIASTPYMDEAAECDRIALIQDGAFLTTDSPADIVRAYDKRLWAVSSDRMHQLLDDLRAWPHTETAFSFGEAYHVTVTSDARPDNLRQFLENAGHRDVAVAETQPGIEDCFMALATPTSTPSV